jgi:hypothetical protein
LESDPVIGLPNLSNDGTGTACRAPTFIVTTMLWT